MPTKWTPNMIATCRRILAKHDSIPAALPKIRRALQMRTLGLEQLRSAIRRQSRRRAATSRDPRAGRDKVYVILSDIHVPYHDERAAQAICQLLRDLRPHGLVINGDFLDLIELSKHASQSVAQLEGLRIVESFKAGNALLDRYMTAAGKQCRDNRFVDGNHENRLDRWLAAGDNAVWLGDEATSLAGRLRFKERGFMHAKGYPKAYTKLGHLLVTHGRRCGKYAAAQHLDIYRHSIITGHGHTPAVFYGSGLEKQQIGVMTGHLADIHSKALSYAPVPNSWRTGFAVVVVEPSGSFHLQPVNFVNGAYYFGAKKYGKSA